MVHFLNCQNPRCRFILDLRVNGKLLSDAQLILKKCTACGRMVVHVPLLPLATNYQADSWIIARGLLR